MTTYSGWIQQYNINTITTYSGTVNTVGTSATLAASVGKEDRHQGTFSVPLQWELCASYWPCAAR